MTPREQTAVAGAAALMGLDHTSLRERAVHRLRTAVGTREIEPGPAAHMRAAADLLLEPEPVPGPA